ncbi:MAG: hypothetical protein N2379_01100 [Verrucomicrobiae bacterium]|nr:hypothetical protein [Verrucomicrobiae bacterium]
MTKSATGSTAQIGRKLAEMFAKNGCLRAPDLKRRKSEGGEYHAGYEIRLVADDKQALKELRSMLASVNLKPGREFKKGKRLVVPVYGKDQVLEFTKLIRPYLPRPVAARKLKKCPA